jgi:hypothetical protein
VQIGDVIMNQNDPQTWIIAAIVVVVLIALAWAIERQRRSKHLRQRFGSEYDRTVSARGDRAKAEAELVAREKRVERLKIVPLSQADAALFAEQWRVLQSRFVDNPKGVVAEADRLVREVMTKRGYPVGDFDSRVDDISVHHPGLVETYRAAQAIAVRDQQGEASTEELRKAVVYYRALFDELLVSRDAKVVTAPSRARAHTKAVHQ